jgi:hypothetical protein
MRVNRKESSAHYIPFHFSIAIASSCKLVNLKGSNLFCSLDWTPDISAKKVSIKQSTRHQRIIICQSIPNFTEEKADLNIKFDQNNKGVCVVRRNQEKAE